MLVLNAEGFLIVLCQGLVSPWMLEWVDVLRTVPWKIEFLEVCVMIWGGVIEVCDDLGNSNLCLRY